MPAETVFLSYVAEDRGAANQLKNDLTRSGVVVVDRASLVKPGTRLRAGVKRAIESASQFVLCLSSRDGLPPAYAQDELAAAIATGRSIIPVRFTRCDIPAVALGDSDTLADIEAVDIFDDWVGGVRQLASVLPVSLPPKEAPAGRITLTAGRLKTKGVELKSSDVDMRINDEMDNDGKLTAGKE